MIETKERTGTVEVRLEVPAEFHYIIQEVAHTRGMEVRELILDNFIPGLEQDLEANEALAYRFGFEDNPDIAEELRRMVGLEV